AFLRQPWLLPRGGFRDDLGGNLGGGFRHGTGAVRTLRRIDPMGPEELPITTVSEVIHQSYSQENAHPVRENLTADLAIDPLDLAIRKISETRNLLALVITSSESFDYLKAKAALAELQLKIRDLARLQAKL